MEEFPKDSYLKILAEIRNRMHSARVLSKEKNIVFLESTTLQIRKILELIAYLSVLVNLEKLNSSEKNEWHARRIIETLERKTTVFYPFPSYMIPPNSPNNDQPVLIPLGYSNALTQDEFVNTYQRCGNILHAQHPLKKLINFEKTFTDNRTALDKIAGLLQSHTIGIKHTKDKYTFIFIEFDFSNSEEARPTVIREYKTHIYKEEELLEIFKNL